MGIADSISSQPTRPVPMRVAVISGPADAGLANHIKSRLVSCKHSRFEVVSGNSSFPLNAADVTSCELADFANAPWCIYMLLSQTIVDGLETGVHSALHHLRTCIYALAAQTKGAVRDLRLVQVGPVAIDIAMLPDTPLFTPRPGEILPLTVRDAVERLIDCVVMQCPEAGWAPDGLAAAIYACIEQQQIIEANYLAAEAQAGSGALRHEEVTGNESNLHLDSPCASHATAVAFPLDMNMMTCAEPAYSQDALSACAEPTRPQDTDSACADPACNQADSADVQPEDNSAAALPDAGENGHDVCDSCSNLAVPHSDTERLLPESSALGNSPSSSAAASRCPPRRCPLRGLFESSINIAIGFGAQLRINAHLMAIFSGALSCSAQQQRPFLSQLIASAQSRIRGMGRPNRARNRVVLVNRRSRPHHSNAGRRGAGRR
eukprot:m.238890 g.238890  ORF g.238890 m.238890 type:complete len:435 (+) comp13384_c0_seq1:76-1380(+)